MQAFGQFTLSAGNGQQSRLEAWKAAPGVPDGPPSPYLRCLFDPTYSTLAARLVDGR